MKRIAHIAIAMAFLFLLTADAQADPMRWPRALATIAPPALMIGILLALTWDRTLTLWPRELVCLAVFVLICILTAMDSRIAHVWAHQSLDGDLGGW